MDKNNGIKIYRKRHLVTVFLISVVFYLSITNNQAPLHYNVNLLKQPTNLSGNTSNNQHLLHQQHFICPKFVGRAGNWMFQFASSYGISKLKGMIVIISDKCKLLEAFDLKVDIREDISFCSLPNTKHIYETKPAAYDRHLIKFDNNTDVRLMTYLQSYRYFEEYQDDLRQQFTFKETIFIKAVELLELYLKQVAIYKQMHKIQRLKRKKYFEHNNRNKITLIGVHIRRGDKLTVTGAKVPSKVYLQKAVDLYSSMYNNLCFVVASDDINWAKKNMPNNITVVYLEGHSKWLDLAIITQSDHFISTIGTFGWWAGWLTGGNVTYSKPPAIDGTSYREMFSNDYKDHFYSNWYGL